MYNCNLQVDGAVVCSLSDNQLAKLGISTVGDRYHLRQFVGEPGSTSSTISKSQETKCSTPSEDRQNRKKLLASWIRERSALTPVPRKKPGRPKASARQIICGLRILQGSTNHVYVINPFHFQLNKARINVPVQKESKTS
jgi:hypothetical protein